MRLISPLIVLLSVPLATTEMCGQQRRRVKRVVGGTTAERGAWPWQILIYFLDESTGKDAMCGGTVIGRKWVLTAAHCQRDFAHYGAAVYAGFYQFDASDEQHRYEIDYFIYHPGYKGPTENDIAIVKLSQPLIYSDTIQPICLPSNDDEYEYSDNILAYVIGWGDTLYHKALARSPVNQDLHHRPAVLRQAEVLTTINEYDSSENVFMNFLIVASPKLGTGSCFGDSGGPLMLQSSMESDVWYQHGIVSGGDGCGDLQEFYYYTRVSAYCDFIEEATAGEVFCRDPRSRCRDSCAGPRASSKKRRQFKRTLLGKRGDCNC